MTIKKGDRVRVVKAEHTGMAPVGSEGVVTGIRRRGGAGFWPVVVDMDGKQKAFYFREVKKVD